MSARASATAADESVVLTRKKEEEEETEDGSFSLEFRVRKRNAIETKTRMYSFVNTHCCFRRAFVIITQEL